MTDARYSREVLALALARESAHRLGRGLDGTGYLPQLAREDLRHLLTAFDVLDNAGVFSSLDAETDYMAAADVLAANAADRPLADPGSLVHSQIKHPSGQVPTDRELKGCTHPADQPCFGKGVQGYLGRYSRGPESIKPQPTGDQARALFGDTEADPEDAALTQWANENDPAPADFSDTHPRAAQELGDLIRGDEADGRF